jgi:hypothetical protein
MKNHGFEPPLARDGNLFGGTGGDWYLPYSLFSRFPAIFEVARRHPLVPPLYILALPAP